jgi:hypothetical protein
VNRSKLLVDSMVSAFVPFLAIWLYESSNLVVLAEQGYSVTFSMVGLLPLGVAGASTGGLSPATKAIQVVLALVPLVIFAKLLSKADLRIAEAFAISFVGVYFASIYWEMLSLLTMLPMAGHIAIFVVGTGCLSSTLLRVTRFDRPKPASRMTIGSLTLPA